MKKEKVEMTTEEALAKAFKISLNQIQLEDEFYLKHLDIKLKFLSDRLISKREEEPCKFFKKAHQKWEDEVNTIEEEIQDIYEKIGNTISERQQFINKLKEN